MRVGFDATTFNLTKGGTTVYLYNLMLTLKKIEPNSEFKTYSFGNDYTNRKEFIQKKIETLFRELFWQLFIFPKKAEKQGMDIIHSPAHIAPLRSKLPRVVTFHDIYILKNPSSFKKWQSNYAKHILPKVLNSGIFIISVSEFTKSEILARFKIPEDQIFVVPNGVSDNFNLIQDSNILNKVRQKYNLPSEFLLYVGAIEPRKNIHTLIKALKIVQEKIKIKLVIASPGGWNNKEIQKLMSEATIKKLIVPLGYVDIKDLPALYNLASLFIYPSIYEGFGLPVLEAMACGCPVIASKGSAINEVVGNAGLLFEPTDHEKLANDIIFVLSSTELSIKLSELGLERSKLFSWENCARKTAEIYRKLI